MIGGLPARRQDVARLAGVALTTVSLVLNRTPGTRIPAATRQRVEAAARELGYQSSALARALVSGRSGAVGTVLHYTDQPFRHYVAGVLDGFWTAILAAGYRMMIAKGSAEHCLAGLYRERSVDGLLAVVPSHAAGDPELHDLLAAGFPTVFVGSRPLLPGGDYVDIDNRAAGRAVTEALIAAGHRRILHLAGPLAVNSAALERLAGHRDAMADAGLACPDDLVIDCSFNDAFAVERVGAAVDRGLRFTAIAAASHAMAYGAMQALHRRGIVVPTQVSLAAIDRAHDTIPGGCQITSLPQPLAEIGLQAGQRLLARMAGDRSAPAVILLPCLPPVGDSIAPPS